MFLRSARGDTIRIIQYLRKCTLANTDRIGNSQLVLFLYFVFRTSLYFHLILPINVFITDFLKFTSYIVLHLAVNPRPLCYCVVSRNKSSTSLSSALFTKFTFHGEAKVTSASCYIDAKLHLLRHKGISCIVTRYRTSRQLGQLSATTSVVIVANRHWEKTAYMVQNCYFGKIS